MNDQVLVLLDQIDPNPYQPRQTEDAAAVQELADSIVRNGLLQVPTARKANGRYQLAFGHTRLAAFRLLSKKSNIYNTMPLNVQELSELQMFELAVAENIKRRELNPIEQAEAMRVYMTQFEKNSVETGAFFGVSPETVRGTVRLNDLAPAAKDALRAGKITVSTARSLLSLQKVAPAGTIKEVLKEITSEADNMTPDEIIEETIDDLQGVVTLWNGYDDGKARAGRSGWLLDTKNFPNKLLPVLDPKDLKKLSAEQQEHLANPPACNTCPFYTKVRGNHYCGLQLCYDRKVEAWTAQKMTDASRQSKIPVYQEADGIFRVLDGYRDEALFKKANKDLRLILKAAAKQQLGYSYFYQSYTGIDSDLFLVVATGDALNKLSKDSSSSSGSTSNRGNKGKRTEKEKQEMRMMKVYRARRKDMMWECASVARTVFDGVPLEVLRKLCNWENVWADDEIPDAYRTAADDKADYQRRALVWRLIMRESSHYHRKSMVSIVNGMKTLFSITPPKSLIKQAEAWDAEIKAAAAGRSK